MHCFFFLVHSLLKTFAATIFCNPVVQFSSCPILFLRLLSNSCTSGQAQFLSFWPVSIPGLLAHLSSCTSVQCQALRFGPVSILAFLAGLFSNSFISGQSQFSHFWPVSNLGSLANLNFHISVLSRFQHFWPISIFASLSSLHTCSPGQSPFMHLWPVLFLSLLASPNSCISGKHAVNQVKIQRPVSSSPLSVTASSTPSHSLILALRWAVPSQQLWSSLVPLSTAVSSASPFWRRPFFPLSTLFPLCLKFCFGALGAFAVSCPRGQPPIGICKIVRFIKTHFLPTCLYDS